MGLDFSIESEQSRRSHTVSMESVDLTLQTIRMWHQNQASLLASWRVVMVEETHERARGGDVDNLRRGMHEEEAPVAILRLLTMGKRRVAVVSASCE